MLEQILKHYPIQAPQNITKIIIGLINESYKIETRDGVFVLQKLNPIFSPEVMPDIQAVSEYMETKGMRAQKIIPTDTGGLFVQNGSDVWRLLTYIEGEVFQEIETPDIAHEAGKILGQFHAAMQDFHYDFRHHRELHHATEKLFALFQKTTTDTTDQEIENLKKIINGLPDVLLPSTLRKTVTHGDPKISNVIFRNGQAVALIDFDDVGNHHSVLIELGDAMRSWCAEKEDDPNNVFHLKKFEAVWRGYIRGSDNFLTAEERKLLPQAVKLVTLELASRFLRDYFEDSYFGWDKNKYPSRRAHNLARTRGQAALYNDILKKEDKMHEIIQSII